MIKHKGCEPGGKYRSSEKSKKRIPEKKKSEVMKFVRRTFDYLSIKAVGHQFNQLII